MILIYSLIEGPLCLIGRYDDTRACKIICCQSESGLVHGWQSIRTQQQTQSDLYRHHFPAASRVPGCLSQKQKKDSKKEERVIRVCSPEWLLSVDPGIPFRRYRKWYQYTPMYALPSPNGQFLDRDAASSSQLTDKTACLSCSPPLKPETPTQIPSRRLLSGGGRFNFSMPIIRIVCPLSTLPVTSGRNSRHDGGT